MRAPVERPVTAASESTRASAGPDTRSSTAIGNGGIPDYLSRSYWWAYLSPLGTWFFDHQPIINAILFGQYRRLMRRCLTILDPERAGITLQLAAVYGVLTPTLAKRLPRGALFLTDVAAVQLRRAGTKLDHVDRPRQLTRANAESLPYANNSFDTVLLFFLLHELPTGARNRVLREAARIVRPGGALVIADYGAISRSHPFHWRGPFRALLERLEPYLGEFWRQDLSELIAACMEPVAKAAECEAHAETFGGFYRIQRYRVRRECRAENTHGPVALS